MQPVTRAVVIEKRPEAGAVQEEVRAAPDAAKPCHAAHGVVLTAAGEIWVANGVVDGPGGRGVAGGAWTLPVGRFALLHGCENVLGVVEIVLVESGMLDRRTVQPSGHG